VTERMRILVADDELLARKRLIRLLGAIEGAEVVGECATGNAVLERLREEGVDVVLLDVQMPGLSGIEALSLLGEEAPLVILCTAHPDYALDAFELGAVDYVVKPVEAARLKKALLRAARQLELRRSGAAGGPKPPAGTSLARLAIPTRQGIVLLDPEEISHAVLDGELVSVFTEHGVYLSDDTLGDLHDRLPDALFARVHRRALVNLARVVRLEPVDSGGFVAHTRSGHQVEVSRQAARELRRRLGVR
jgi:two-component system LytT family response regulator